MVPVPPFRLPSSARALLADLGVAPVDLLAATGLPPALFGRSEVLLPPEDYYRLFTAMEDLATVPHLPIALTEAMTADTFDVPVFAALCSPDLITAAERLAAHKRLLGPMRLEVDRRVDGTLRLTARWPPGPPPPPVLPLVETLFVVRLARMATRHRVVPLQVEVPEPPAATAAYRDHLGVEVTAGPDTAVTFSRADAGRPFLTADAGMWAFFAPELRRRLAQLDADASTAEAVRAALVELLPAGAGTTRRVARHLGMSTRTLQRRLGEEGVTFQGLLAGLRESLARHYLGASPMPVAEIAFLLGYDDPGSFSRAFACWTGASPQAVRAGRTPQLAT